MIKERIKTLQKELVKENIGVYLVPTSDYHGSEYVSDYFKVREFMSGFTGSAGTLVVTKEKAFLFADGRYFIQAENQIKGTGIELIKMGQDKMPTLEELILRELNKGENIGFDSGLISTSLGKYLQKVAKANKGQIIEKDLINDIWIDRPALPKEKLFILDTKYAGETTKSKLKRIKSKLRENHASSTVIASLPDIAWILNLRGNDVECTPVFLSYLIINHNEYKLFIDKTKINKEVQAYLDANNIKIYDYFDIKEHVKALKGTVLVDPASVNYGIYSAIKVKKVEKTNPSVLMRSIKNKTELKNIRLAHIKDGVAMCKFMYWLKTNVGKIKMSEVSIQNHLYDLRAQADNYVGPSFETICAYKDHGAMMHYSATKETDVPVFAEDLLLVDSGGHYLEGTTDITRTYILGKVSLEQKMHYTTVLESVLNLMRAKFLYGCTGIALDILCRGPLWNLNMDYKCGTGHGVGYLLSVHEGPQGFRWRIVPERMDSGVLEEGMVTTDEPGVYLEGKYGIRTENELICKKLLKNDDGTFMGFECITYVPIDLDGIDKEYLSKENIALLNEYHKMVYKTISPYLNEDEKKFLKEYTKSI